MNYNIIRCARKSVSISISPQNQITVRCPRHFTDDRIHKFIESRRDWIYKTVNSNSIKLSLNREVLEYRQVYVAGVRVPLIFSDKNEITQSAVYIKSIKDIKRIFIQYFSESFMASVEKISEHTGFNFNSVSFRYYKSRWGCCDRQGKAIFNYLLFMLPADIQKYVIIHELCHLIYFNHSKAFWQIVAKYEPDYKQIRTRLKDFNFITNLY